MPLRFALVACLIALCIFTAAETQLQNYTILAPVGATDHGDPRDFCLPASMLDYLLFYFGNYIAHAATVVTDPGEKAINTLSSVICALIFPASGVSKALSAISRHARIARRGSYAGERKLDKLRCAARAGALCMLVRSETWEPRNGDVIRESVFVPDGATLETLSANAFTTREVHELQRVIVDPIPNEGGQLADGDDPSRCSQILDPCARTDLSAQPRQSINTFLRNSNAHLEWTQSWQAAGIRHIPSLIKLFGRISETRRIHGSHKIPSGYTFWYVPNDAELSSFGDGASDTAAERSIEDLSVSYDVSKALIAIVQTVYAAITLYKARGSQIDQYGYAAFGLTVTPYLVMSIVNLTANLVTPSYDALYLVHNDVMSEAEQRGGYFDGVVGRVEPATPTRHPHLRPATFKMQTLDPDTEDSPAQTMLVLHTEQRPDIPLTYMVKKNDEAESFLLPVKKATRIGLGPYLAIPACSSVKRSNKHPCYYTSDHDDGQSLLLYSIAAIPIIIIGALSGFHKGSSTVAQRVWTMMWLVFGIVFGPVARSTARGRFATLLGLMVWAVPAIGGMVVVGQMLSGFGVCTRLY